MGPTRNQRSCHGLRSDGFFSTWQSWGGTHLRLGYLPMRINKHERRLDRRHASQQFCMRDLNPRDFRVCAFLIIFGNFDRSILGFRCVYYYIWAIFQYFEEFGNMTKILILK